MLPVETVVSVWEKAVCGVISHGFSIRFSQLDPPKTGTFDGLEIVLSPENHLELQVFILLHLFGHSVQWVAPSLSDSIVGIQEPSDLDTFLAHLQAYESEAAQLGLQLLHDQGVSDVDDWFSRFAATDWKYVHTYYVSGSIPAWSDCVVASAERVTPKRIPPLSHRKVNVRFAF